MNQWICLCLAVVSWLLGHATGYRLCRLRVKNMLLKRMMDKLVSPSYSDAYSRVLTDITKM